MFSTKNRIITAISIILFITLLSIFALIPIEEKHAVSIWMKDVDDNTLITTMSIPGTHDSGATHSIFDVAGKCQDTTIKQQLELGVRFLDLRLQLVNNEFKIVHSFVDQKQKLKSVLKDISTFIKEYNTEFLIISIKEEADSKNSTLDFEEALFKEFKEYEDILCYNNLPNTLKEARGKIYILSRYANSSIGIKAYSGWKDSTTFTIDNLYIQDNYCIDDLEIKKQDIIDTINYSKANSINLVLNFTSCYLDNAFPPTYAGTAALNINPWLIEHLKSEKGNLGIVIVDFVTKELAEAIYMRNVI